MQLRKRQNLVGRKFSKLLVLECAEVNVNSHKSLWLCKCDCGNEKIVTTQCLLHGNTKSCGCLKHGWNSLPENEAFLNEIYRKYKKNALARNLEFNLTKEEVKNIIIQNCYYCGVEPKSAYVSAHSTIKSWFNSNGIDRLDSSKGYTIENTVPCCRYCNYSKRDQTYDQYMEHLYRIARKYKDKV